MGLRSLVLVLVLFHRLLGLSVATPSKNQTVASLAAPWRVRAPGGGTKMKLRICVCAWTPHVINVAANDSVFGKGTTLSLTGVHGMQVLCNAGEPPETFSGYQVELWREVTRRIPWLETDAYFFDCLPYPDMYEDITSPNGTCFAAPLGLDVTIENMKAGIKYSW